MINSGRGVNRIWQPETSRVETVTPAIIGYFNFSVLLTNIISSVTTSSKHGRHYGIFHTNLGTSNFFSSLSHCKFFIFMIKTKEDTQVIWVMVLPSSVFNALKKKKKNFGKFWFIHCSFNNSAFWFPLPQFSTKDWNPPPQKKERNSDVGMDFLLHNVQTEAHWCRTNWHQRACEPKEVLQSCWTFHRRLIWSEMTGTMMLFPVSTSHSSHWRTFLNQSRRL